jgi:hypothetical protein
MEPRDEQEREPRELPRDALRRVIRECAQVGLGWPEMLRILSQCADEHEIKQARADDRETKHS